MFCKRCGKQIPDNSNACQYCGAMLTQRPMNNTYNSNYQPQPKPQKKTPWKIIVPIVAVVVVLAIVISVVSCVNIRKNEDRKRLLEVLEASTDKPVVEFIHEDFDSDGTTEAYAVVGESEEKEDYTEYLDAEIYYVNQTKAEIIKESVSGHSNGTIEVDDTIYVSLEVYDEGTYKGVSFIYTAEDNKPVESDISGKYSDVHQDGGKILATDEDGTEIEIEIENKADEEKSDEPKADYNKLYEDYIQNTLAPQYGKGKNVYDKITNIYPENQIMQRINLASGMCSTYIEDLNSDNIPEMVTVRIENEDYQGMVYVELYTIENDTVTPKGEITSSDKYDNASEQFSVYTVEQNNKQYLCIGSNGGATSMASVQGESLEIFTVNSSNQAENIHNFAYSYAHGNVVLRHNDTSYQTAVDGYPNQTEIRNARQYFTKELGAFGLEEFQGGSANEEIWLSLSRPPEEADHIKIFYGGTEYVNDGESNVYFAKDHTGFLD